MSQQRSPSWSRLTLIAVGAAGAAGVILAAVALVDRSPYASRTPRLTQHGGVVDWWDPIPETLKEASVPLKPNLAAGESRPVAASGAASNIAFGDYSGPDSCRKCHPKQHAAWSEHPHRWMNTVATTETVLGDFEQASAAYLGGRAAFFREPGVADVAEAKPAATDSGYRMLLERDGVRRLYQVTQTIGSRFYQYYVGVLLEGPEPPSDRSYQVDHLLPFGYWLDRQEWTPTVHVHWARLHGKAVDEEDLPSELRHDPFAAPHKDFSFTAYYQCSQCHTTMPLGDLLVRNPGVIGRHAPLAMHFAAADYLQSEHPQLPALDQPEVDELGNVQPNSDNLADLLGEVQRWDAREHAVTLGVSCESCHLGAREHAEGRAKRPDFFPQSQHLYVYSDSPLENVDAGRTHTNLNWACGRCHAGGRRLLAGGMATWNSTEYTDAMRGSCYSQLQCVDCHNPHETIGKKWSLTERQNDQSCLRCHEQFQATEALESHTHHAAGSAGSRCMDCHMPRVNEGLQDMVRTHMIYSPTQPEMIEANHPNACNMCHVDQPIDWTLSKLTDWYGKQYDESKIAQHYPQRDAPTAVGWVRSPDQSVRVIGIDSLSRADARWALPEMLRGLDDPFIINRQFARIALEKMLDVTLADYGYRHSMTRLERQQPLARIRAALLSEGPAGPTPPGPNAAKAASVSEP